MSKIEIGQPAPDFSLADQEGRITTLSGCRGNPLVLYFYPKDDTPGCTKQACGFRDAFEEYRSRGVRILGISPDDVASHARFASKYQLPFTLLADPEHQTCSAYGVWKEKNLYGRKSMGVERTTFLVDDKGVIRGVFPRVKVDGHIAAVLASLDELSGSR